LKEVIRSIKLEALIFHTQRLIYECLYRRILEFNIVGSPCAEEHIWILNILASIRARRLRPWSLCHMVVLVTLWWALI
jgi:hypothetical protein